ncbi:innexin inx2 isoform X1 [Eurytemora carolleeae]|uniref:innexin inx2 isoform X1 n=1 Tax=Eurytemora carolleeae TaxID=1294199 RepID=UPI000C75B15F|nr:innexin inx2 isoform X1 [Eurytemora carolleeae]|eukprot:XP_023320356.1 innexin inx2-like isoform X1 [Eurytemora affinis]
MSVLALFGAVKNLLSPKCKSADISTSAFKVSRWTGIVLLIFSILTTSKQFFGEPILCNPTKIPTNMFSAYCFMTGTITQVDGERLEEVPDTHAHHGISSLQNGKMIRHDYYQWVPFILFFQAILFYAPYRAWKMIEGGKLDKLLAKVSSDPLTETPLSEQVQGISKFLAAKPCWYNCFARKMFICELGILLLSVLQMYFLDIILGERFFGLGHDFMSVTYPWEYVRVVEEVFPLVTNCRMNYVGSSGSAIQDSGICILNVNILNQKIFLISWYLQIFLIAFTTVKVLLDIVLILVPGARYIMLRSQAKSLQSHVLSRVNCHGNFGFYTLLTLIAKNVDGAQFEALLLILSDKIAGRNDMHPSSILNMQLNTTKQFEDNFIVKEKQSIYHPETSADVRMRKEISPPTYRDANLFI